MDCLKTKTYAMFRKAAKFALLNAKESEEGRLWNCMFCVSYSAFALEAYLNHLGAELLPGWEAWDTSNRPNIHKKLSRIAGDIGKKIDYSVAPYNQINGLFEIRDAIVHGRTYSDPKKVRKPQNNAKGAMINLSSEVERYCTLNNTEAVFEAVENIIEGLNSDSLKLSQDRLWSIAGEGSFRTG